jgi:hypothetical protein
MKNLIITALALWGLAACTSKPQTVDLPGNDITFDTVSKSLAYPFAYTDSDTVYLSQSIFYLHPANSNASGAGSDNLEKIQRHLQYIFFGDSLFIHLEPQKAIELYMENTKKTFRSEMDMYKDEKASEYAELPAVGNSENRLSDSILFNSFDFLSLSVQRLYSTADAQDVRISTITYDLLTGMPLTEDDIFAEGSAEDLHSLFIDYLLEKHNKATVEELNNAGLGYENLEDIVSNHNFYIDYRSIVFTFNSGEYSTPDLGSFEIKLAIDDLDGKGLLKPESPIMRMLTDKDR